MTEEKIIIDATNSPLGRLSSYAAKQALLGKSLIVVNCENAIVSGRKTSIIEHYREERAKGSSSLKGPHFPKEPFRLVKRTIRGMLPYKQGRGRTALKKIICYNDIPKEYADMKKISLQKEFSINVITLKEISQLI